MDAISSFNKHVLSASFSSTTILGGEDVVDNKAEKFLPMVMLLYQNKGDQINKLNTQYVSCN